MNAANDPAQWMSLFTLYLGQLPMMLVSLVGCVLMVARWNSGARAAAWALAGFGLSFVICVVIPLGQKQLTKLLAECGQAPVDPARAFAFLGMVWAVLRAVSLGCLLVALVVRRAANEA